MALAPFPETTAPDSIRTLRMSERVEQLVQLPLFSQCSKRHLRALARLTRQQQLEAGATLITEGSDSDEAYVILAGLAVVRRKGRKIAELRTGDVAGELGLLLERPRMATVSARTPLECLVIRRSDLRACIAEAPDLGWLLLQTVALRLSSATHSAPGQA